MARTFTKNTANHLDFGTHKLGPLVDGAGAISVHCWCKPASIGVGGVNDNVLLAWSITAGGGSGGYLNIDSSAKLRLQGRSVSTDGLQTKTGTTSITTGSWWSLGGVLDIAGDVITPYINGSAEGGGAVTFGNGVYTDNASAGGTDRIGCDTAPASTAKQTDGVIADVVIWNGDIGANGFKSLATGASPLRVQPARIVTFVPLNGGSPEANYCNAGFGVSAAITGTLALAAGPPTMPLWGLFMGWEGQAMSPLTAAVAQHRAQALRPRIFAPGLAR